MLNNVVATSAAHLRAWETSGVPDVEQVRDDVWAIPVPMTSPHLRFTFAYVLLENDRRAHVIDPGLASDAGWGALTAGLRRAGVSVADVASITMTHGHADHVGLAVRLHNASGGQVYMSREDIEFVRGSDRLGSGNGQKELESWGVPVARWSEITRLWERAAAVAETPVALLPPHVLEPAALCVPGFSLNATLMRGHTTGSVVIADNERRIVFTGDHLLPVIFPGIGLGANSPNNSLADYLESLEQLANFDDFEALPGHVYRFRGVAARRGETRSHHLRRAREVRDALSRDPDTSTFDLAACLTWTAGFSNLEGFYLFSALRQTEMHRDFVMNHSDDFPELAT